MHNETVRSQALLLRTTYFVGDEINVQHNKRPKRTKLNWNVVLGRGVLSRTPALAHMKYFFSLPPNLGYRIYVVIRICGGYMYPDSVRLSVVTA